VSLNTAPAAPRLLRPPISAAEDPKQPPALFRRTKQSIEDVMGCRASVHKSFIAHFSKNDSINKTLTKNITSASGTRNQHVDNIYHDKR